MDVDRISTNIAAALFGGRKEELMATATRKSESLAPRKRRTPPPAKVKASAPTCRSCGVEIEEGTNGLCDDCDPEASGSAPDAPDEAGPAWEPGERPVRPGDVLNTTSPMGMLALDPDALPRRDSREPAAQEDLGVERSVPLCEIARSMFQPRIDFNEEELQSLADSLKEHGLLQSIVVRPIDPELRRLPLGVDRPRAGQVFAKYELVAGERRARAALCNGWAEIPATVRKIEDRLARELAIIENLKRSDLSDVEKARAFRNVIKENGYTITQWGKKIGFTQGHISNLLRLLELPEAWQQRIIAREMTTKHALEVLPYKDIPEVLAALDKAVKQALKSDGGLGTVGEWAEEIDEVVWRTTYDLDTHVFVNGSYKNVSIPLDESTREQLRLVKVRMHNGQSVERALNQKLAKQLLDKACAEAQAKGAKNGKVSGKASKPDEKPRKPTAAELKAKTADAARVFDKRMQRWRLDWTAYLCSLAIKPGTREAVWPLIYMATEQQHGTYSELQRSLDGRRDALEQVLQEEAGAARMNDACDGLVKLTDYATVSRAAALLVRRSLWDGENGATRLLPDRVIEQLAVDLEIDFAAAWAKEKGGPLTEDFLEIHTKDQLEELGEQLGVYVGRAKTKSDMVKLIIAHTKPTKLPK